MNYQQTAKCESASLGVKADVALSNMTEKEKQIVSHMVQDCYHALIMERINNDPVNIENGKKEEESLKACFPCPIYVKKAENPYFKDYTNKPRLIVTTHKGPISIHWRKRVIEIDWNESDVKTSSMEIFPDEDVTRGVKLIHAWGYQKAAEYIKKILESE